MDESDVLLIGGYWKCALVHSGPFFVRSVMTTLVTKVVSTGYDL